jgi:hypothetical protein
MTPKPDDRSTLVDPRVADAWREASGEEPSASIDDAILAAARRELSTRPETLAAWEARKARASRRRWWPLAAAATVAAIAVGVLQLTPTEKIASPATETATVSDVPPPAAKPDANTAAAVPEVAPPPSASPPADAAAPKPAPLQSTKEKSMRSDDARAKGEARRVEAQQRSAPAAASAAPSEREPPAAPAERQQRAAPAFASTPDPFPAAAKPPAENAAAGGQVAASPPVSAQRAPAPASGPAAASEPAPAPAPALAAASAPALAKVAGAAAADNGVAETRAKDRKPLPVADWIALIRRLRVEGKTDEAAKELAAFRAAHPEHEKLLPPDLRDWRPSSK